MKKCPFCAEDIQEDAIKCRYCGEFLGNPIKKKLFSKTALILAFLTVGPLALPLLWANPHISKDKKTTITIVVVGLTIILVIIMVKCFEVIINYYQQVFML